MHATAIRVSIPSSPKSWTCKALNLFKHSVERLDPSLKVEVHHSASLFKQGQEIDALMQGTLDAATISMSDISAKRPERAFQLLCTPFLFRNLAHLTSFYEGPIAKDLFSKLDLQILTPLFIGTRVISLKKAMRVSRPEDLAAVRLRVPEAPSWQQLARTLGAQPVPVAIGQIERAYLAGDIDGHENPLSASLAYELLPHVSQIVKTDHVVDCIFLSLSKQLWNRLTQAQQHTLQVAAQIARKYNDEQRLKEEVELLDKHKAIIVRPDLHAFRAKASVFDPFIDQVAKACHPAIVESHNLWPGLGQVNSKTGNLVQADDGSILACWYGGNELPGTKQGFDETGLWISRYSQGEWSEPRCLQLEARYSIWNPVLMKFSNGKLGIFFRKFPMKEAEPHVVKHKTREFTYHAIYSPNNGRDWTVLQKLPEGVTGPVKCSPLSIGNGMWLIPSAKDQRISLELLNEEDLSIRKLKSLPHDSPLTEPCFVADSHGNVQIYMRNRQDNPQGRFIMKATYNPQTQEASPIEPTTIPNPDSGIDALRLADGRMILVCNPEFDSRKKLALYTSTDQGTSWQFSFTLQEADGAYSQPALMQASDGKVHLTYSWLESEEKNNIKHLVLDPKLIP